MARWVGLLLASLTLPSPVHGQVSLLVGLAQEEGRKVAPALRYDGDEWVGVRYERLPRQERRDSLAALSAQLPRTWYVPDLGRSSIEVPVGPADESLEQPIPAWPERLHVVQGLGAVFSQSEVTGYPFQDIRGNVIKWSRALELVEPVFDSAEVAWVRSLPEGTPPRIPGQLADRQTRPVIFTTLLQAGPYIWFEARRVYLRSPEHPDPRCWDVAVLEGWLLEEPRAQDDPDRVEGLAGFHAVRMSESFRVTDCDDKGHGYFRPYSTFSFDDQEWVLALRAEYDAMHEGLEAMVLHRVGGKLEESTNPSSDW